VTVSSFSARYVIQYSDVISLASLLGTLLAVSEVSIKASLLTAGLFVYFGVCGTTIMSVLLPAAKRLTKVSLGIVVSIIAWTLTDQLLRSSPLRPLGLVFFGGLVFLSLRWIQRSQAATNSQPQQTPDVTSQSHLILIVVTSTVFLLAQHWFWMVIPACFALLLVLTQWITDSVRPAIGARVALLSSCLMLLAVGVSSLRREEYWWLPKYGMDEFEYLSHGAYTWGQRIDVLASNIPSGYQWFHFASAGLFEITSQSGDWVFTTRIDFVLSAMLVGVSVLALLSEVVVSRTWTVIGTSLSMIVSTPIFYPNQFGLFTPNHRGLVAVLLVAVVLSSLAWAKARFSWQALTPTLLIIFALTASKTVVLVPIAVAYGVVGIAFIYSRDWKQLTKIAAVYGALLLSVLTTVRSGSGLSFSFHQPGRFVSTYLGFDFYTRNLFGSLKQQIFLGSAAIAILLGMSGLALITSVQLWRFGSRRLSAALAATLTIGTLIAILGSRLSDTHMHFLQVPVVASIPLSIAASSQVFRALLQNKKLWVLLLHLFSVLAGIAVTLTALQLDSYVFEVGHALIGSVTFVLLLALCSACYAIFRMRRAQSFGIELGGLVLSSFLVFSATLGVANWFTIPKQSLYESGYTQGQLGTQELQSIANWISKNTEQDEILATNIGLGAESNQSECPNTASTPTDGYITLVTLLERRFVVTGIRIASLTTGADLTQRAAASLSFSCNADQQSLKSLKRYGASYFIGYLPYMSTSLTPKLQYQSGEYGILDLTKLGDS
jgi:hypothetical protein